jgi:hypothetical protein
MADSHPFSNAGLGMFGADASNARNAPSLLEAANAGSPFAFMWGSLLNKFAGTNLPESSQEWQTKKKEMMGAAPPPQEYQTPSTPIAPPPVNYGFGSPTQPVAPGMTMQTQPQRSYRSFLDVQ